jgi:hypothetical protein
MLTRTANHGRYSAKFRSPLYRNGYDLGGGPKPALEAYSGGRVGDGRSFVEQPRHGDERVTIYYYNNMRPMAPAKRFGFLPSCLPSFGYSPSFSLYSLLCPFFSPFLPGIVFSVRMNTAKVERQLAEAKNARNAELQTTKWPSMAAARAVESNIHASVNLCDLEEELAAEKAKSAELETRLRNS